MTKKNQNVIGPQVIFNNYIRPFLERNAGLESMTPHKFNKIDKKMLSFILPFS